MDLAHKGVALVCMLGGAAALPFFPWKPAAWMGAALGLAEKLVAIVPSPRVYTVIYSGGGTRGVDGLSCRTAHRERRCRW